MKRRKAWTPMKKSLDTHEEKAWTPMKKSLDTHERHMVYIISFDCLVSNFA